MLGLAYTTRLTAAGSTETATMGDTVGLVYLLVAAACLLAMLIALFAITRTAGTDKSGEAPE